MGFDFPGPANVDESNVVPFGNFSDGISSRTGALAGTTTALSGTADFGTGVASAGCHVGTMAGGGAEVPDSPLVRANPMRPSATTRVADATRALLRLVARFTVGAVAPRTDSEEPSEERGEQQQPHTEHDTVGHAP